jgi:hypothetical protein
LGELTNEVHQNTTNCCARITVGGKEFGSASKRNNTRTRWQPSHCGGSSHDPTDRHDGRTKCHADEGALSQALSAARESKRSHCYAGARSLLQDLGYVRKVVRTPAGEIVFIVGYSQWWGWFGRPVAVPLEALGIEGGHLVSLDMSPSEYAAAPTWHDTAATPLPADATVRVALSRS